MARKSGIKQDLQRLSAAAHTAESFGRAIIASSLAAAAARADLAPGVKGGTIKFKFDVSVTPIKGIGAWVCVTVPEFGRFCRLERDDRQ